MYPNLYPVLDWSNLSLHLRVPIEEVGKETNKFRRVGVYYRLVAQSDGVDLIFKKVQNIKNQINNSDKKTIII